MAESQYFQFTLGPVQGFVAQARRTRDFWAGSFILSWLSGAAMACIQAQGGQVQFPLPDDSYLRFLKGQPERDDAPPQQGAIPNRFKALTATVPADFNPQWVTETVQRAWQALADAVWQGDLAALNNASTQAIWQRQITNLWEISWVMAAQDGGNLLDRRKNWRSDAPPSEPGHKCMMMAGLQELSGITQTHLASVNQYWQGVRAQGHKGIQNDLREGEHLSAPAFVKRRFSRYFANVKLAMPGELGMIFGWPVPSAVPSVAFLAAAPWLAHVIEQAPCEAFADFHQHAKPLRDGYDEAAHISSATPYEIDIRCVSAAATERQSAGFQRLWAGLDGQVYFPQALQNANLFDQQQTPAALKALHRLTHAAGLNEPPSPFYAIVLMDGDQLGKHMGEISKQAPISRALNRFTREVPDLVREHNGFLVYAGGDDVLALFPLEDALPASAVLQAHYRQCFAQEAPTVDSTLSGAIEYVHIRTPLTRVLQDAHQLLDHVAKEQTGRNAVAVRVWKPSGLALQWAMPWEQALEQGRPIMVRLAAEFSDAQSGFSSKFFFRYKALIERFPTLQANAMSQLLRAEYLHSYGNQHVPALDTLETLLTQCQQWQRPEPGQPARLNHEQPYNPDAALLLRFLASKGLERDSL